MVLHRADLVVAAPTPASVGEIAAAPAATVLMGGARQELSLATAMRNSGTCVLVAETASEADWVKTLHSLLSSADRRQSLAAAKQRFFRADAAWHMAIAIRDLASREVNGLGESPPGRLALSNRPRWFDRLFSIAAGAQGE
jgi:hypothetical protein